MTERGRRFRTILENRHEVLDVLCDRSTTKPELVDSLDTSRSTIDRAIRDLLESGCVTERGPEYIGTTTGHLALEEFEQYRAKTQSIRKTREFLNYLPADAPLDSELLTGATISLAEEHAPEQALKPSIELLRDASSMRGLAPVVLAFYPDLIQNQVQQNGMSVEIVAAKTVLETLPDLVRARDEPLRHPEQISLYEAAGSLPYALWVMDTDEGEYAGITAYDSGGVAGVLINDTDPAVHWAQTQYEHYRDAAEQVTLSSD